MFCSKCGKTVHPEETNCKHCGAPIGDSRFSGNSYTAAQSCEPVESSGQEEANLYTRTTYMSELETEGDVYSRTTYRPVLGDQEAEGQTGVQASDPEEEPAVTPQEPEEAADGASPQEPSGVSPGEADKSREVEHPADKHAPEPEDVPVRRPPIPPVKKAGISPEVKRYMQRMEEQRDADKGKRMAAKSPAVQEEASAQADEYEESAEKAAPFALLERFNLTPRKLISIGIVAVVIVALIIAGVNWVGWFAAERSKIPDVTLDTYKQGIATIEEHISDDYRIELMKLYGTDITAVTSRQDADRQKLETLLPETPLTNDQAFIDALVAIQKAIDNATTMDAIAAATSGDTSLSAISDESEREWEIIRSAVSTLKNATSESQLAGIVTSVEITLKTTPPPESDNNAASGYTKLIKGMMNSTQVANLQRRLSELGYYNGEADGAFGSKTETAVKRFQNAIGEDVIDGIATPEIQVRLFAEDAPKRTAPTPSPTPAGTTAPANPDASPAPGQ